MSVAVPTCQSNTTNTRVPPWQIGSRLLYFRSKIDSKFESWNFSSITLHWSCANPFEIEPNNILDNICHNNSSRTHHLCILEVEQLTICRLKPKSMRAIFSAWCRASDAHCGDWRTSDLWNLSAFRFSLALSKKSLFLEKHLNIPPKKYVGVARTRWPLPAVTGDSDREEL